MKKLITLFPFVFLLTGCPGENLGVGSWRNIIINGSQFCFSMNKTDVLNDFNISSRQGEEVKIFAYRYSEKLYYPDTCINIDLPPGYAYGVSYTLNGESYRYTFVKDNDGVITSLGRLRN